MRGGFRILAFLLALPIFVPQLVNADPRLAWVDLEKDRKLANCVAGYMHLKEMNDKFVIELRGARESTLEKAKQFDFMFDLETISEPDQKYYFDRLVNAVGEEKAKKRVFTATLTNSLYRSKKVPRRYGINSDSVDHTLLYPLSCSLALHEAGIHSDAHFFAEELDLYSRLKPRRKKRR